MGFLPQTIAEQAAGRQVLASELVFLDFLDQPMRYWRGAGRLRTNNGAIWEGTNGLGEISGLDQPLGTIAPSASLTLSGVDQRVVVLSRQQSDRVTGRKCQIYLQFFTAAWAPLDNPLPIWAGEMDRLTYDWKGENTYSVTLSVEGKWTGRRKSPFGFYTDTDQKRRFPGDRGLEQVASLVSKTIGWPSYALFIPILLPALWHSFQWGC